MLRAAVAELERATVIAVDVGGTTIKAARVDTEGRTQAELVVPTGTGDDAIARVLSICSELRTSTTVAVAAAVAGVVDSEAGVVRTSVNLQWTDVALGALISTRLGLPARVVHDVRAASTAEWSIGLGRGLTDFIVVVLGTGLSAGIVSAGHQLAGSTSSAGEVGHMVIRPEGERCVCGQFGCAEVYSSAGGISRRYAQLGGDVGVPVSRLVGSTDSRAQVVWRDATEVLGEALASLTSVLDPQLIVLAGGLSNAGDSLLLPVRTSLDRALNWRQSPRVAISKLTSRAGLAGAAIEAWRLAGVEDADRSWSATVAVTAL